MKRVCLAIGIVLLLLCLSGAALAVDDGVCLYTKTTISPSVANVNGTESFNVTTKTKSICGFPVDVGEVCIYDSFTSLTRITCDDVDDWGKAYFTVHKGEYANFSGPIPTQYIQGRYFDNVEVCALDAICELTPVEEFFFPSITNPGTLVCVGCASGF
ncbi:MAG TPA: hypothetical protein VEG30_11205 [Terriglobales bacterium]|nr:hypothetical protein [Terriglobales bacterium]